MKKTLVALVIGSVVSTGAMAATQLEKVSPLTDVSGLNNVQNDIRVLSNEILITNNSKYKGKEYSALDKEYVRQETANIENVYTELLKDENFNELAVRHNVKETSDFLTFKGLDQTKIAANSRVAKSNLNTLIAKRDNLQEILSLDKKDLIDNYALKSAYTISKTKDAHDNDVYTISDTSGDLYQNLDYDTLMDRITTDIYDIEHGPKKESSIEAAQKYYDSFSGDVELLKQYQNQFKNEIDKSVTDKDAVFAHNKLDALKTQKESLVIQEKALKLSQEQNDKFVHLSVLSSNKELIDFENNGKTQFDDLSESEKSIREDNAEIVDDTATTTIKSDDVKFLDPDSAKTPKADLASSSDISKMTNIAGIEATTTVTNSNVANLNKKFTNIKDFAAKTKAFAGNQVKVNKELRTSIVANTKAINVVAGEVQVNRNQININSTAIETNSTNIATNEKNIGINHGLIVTNQKAIEANSNTLIEHDGRITENTKAIKGLRKDFTNLSNDYYSFKEQTNGAIAGVAAMGQLAQPYGVGKANVGFGVGSYNGEQAIAVGMGYRYNEQTTFRGAVAANTGNDMEPVIAASVNYEW